MCIEIKIKRKRPKRYMTLDERRRKKEMEIQIINVISILFIAMKLVMGIVVFAI